VSPTPRRRQRRRFTDRHFLTADGFFSGTTNSAHNSFFIPLLVQLGVGSTALGIYTAFNGLLTNATGLAGSVVSRHIPNRRFFAALSSGLGRAGLLLIAGEDTNTTLLIVIALASATLIGLGLPVLTTIVADAVNQRERGAFFATRLIASGVGSVIVSIGIAALLRQLDFPAGFTIAYLIAGLAGLGSFTAIMSLRRVRNTPAPPPASGTPFSGLGTISNVMWRYAGATFILWFGAGMVSPILIPFLIDDLGATSSFIGIMTAVNALVAISIQRFWGRRVDRIGSFPVLEWTILAVTSLPILYALTPSFWLALLFEIVSGVGWAGYQLANVNYALELAPHEERTRYTSIANAAAGLGVFLGPLTAAALAAFLDPRAVLAIAGAVRFASWIALRFARTPPV
jgi:MFS family permease